MNKIMKIILAILAGIEVTFYIITPVMVSVLWAIVNDLTAWHTYFIFGIGNLATLFRAIKVGWMK